MSLLPRVACNKSIWKQRHYELSLRMPPQYISVGTTSGDTHTYTPPSLPKSHICTPRAHLLPRMQAINPNRSIIFNSSTSSPCVSPLRVRVHIPGTDILFSVITRSFAPLVCTQFLCVSLRNGCALINPLRS